MKLLEKERAAVVEATTQIKDSSNLLLAVAGIAIVISVVALVVAVVRK